MKQRKKNLSVGLIAGCAVILSAQTVKGQQHDTTKVVNLDEVMVTATRMPKSIDHIGRSITVITSEDIENSGTSSVAELINRKEGFYVVGEQQNPGSTTSIFARGANSNHTIIMIDGIRISDPSSTDNSIDLTELSLANIERIEIVRGSHSTLYGSSAIGGVINIITGTNNQNPGIYVDADLKGGIFGNSGLLRSENVMINYTHESGLYANAEIFNNASKGFNSTTDTITSPVTYKHPDMSDGFKKNDLIGKIGYKSTNMDLYAAYKKAFHHLDIDDGAFRDDENYTVDFSRNMFTYGATYKFNGNFSLRFNGGLSDMIRKAIDDSSKIDADGNTDKTYLRYTYSGTQGSNELQLNYSNKGFQFVLGGSMNKETMS